MKNRIKEIRIKRGMSLGSLGEKTNISPAMLYRYESYDDIYKIPFNKVQNIADALEVSFSTLSGNNSFDRNDIIFSTNKRNSLFHDKNINYKKYSISENDYLSVSDKVDHKKQKVNTITERLMKINNTGIGKIEDYIDFIESKNEYRDDDLYKNYRLYRKIYSELIDDVIKDIETYSKK